VNFADSAHCFKWEQTTTNFLWITSKLSWWSVQFGQFLVCCSSTHGAPVPSHLWNCLKNYNVKMSVVWDTNKHERCRNSDVFIDACWQSMVSGQDGQSGQDALQTVERGWRQGLATAPTQNPRTAADRARAWNSRVDLASPELTAQVSSLRWLIKNFVEWLFD